MRTSRRSILFPGQQIRAIAAGFLKRGGAPPLSHFCVIPSDENLRHSPTPVLRRPCVMRKIQEAVIGDLWSRQDRSRPVTRTARTATRFAFRVHYSAERLVLRRR